MGGSWKERRKEQGKETKIGEVAHYLSATAIFEAPKKGISTVGIGDLNSVLHDDASGDIRFHVLITAHPESARGFSGPITVRSAMGSDGKIPWILQSLVLR